MSDDDALSELRVGPTSDPPDPQGFRQASRTRVLPEDTVFTRLRCRSCGLVLQPSEVQRDGSDVRVHGVQCGPVVEQTARSHREFVEWLFEAAQR